MADMDKHHHFTRARAGVGPGGAPIQFNCSKVPTLAVGTTQNLRVRPAVTCRNEGKLGHPNEVGVQFSLVKWHWLLRVIKR